ncbi:glycosyl transferase [Undibacterium sp. Jales W-56]|uniref:glycosyl transferase n=1 Tax=Undibacterium sp. Jales W-56 TaxID=2897325 RepID=UPI0021CEF812|nr:glycosyl transferase [Undibacterium sp. Jales W-56]MCU6434921.1 glycosyl transferase [Undibacterium sp. Jales W-56]
MDERGCMKKVHVFTSAACNYIPKVRVLIQSIKHWHPEWAIHLALSDQIPAGIDLSQEPFDEIHPADSLGIPDFSGWSFCHNIVELSTAIKPFMLKKLLDRDDCASVIYLDPDTVLFSRLDEVMTALEESNLALTPHQLHPESSVAAVIDNEICSLKHGIYNLGFFAVNSTDIGRAFAAWWAERLYYFCRADIPNGLFTDQRWIDLAPAFFEGVCILRSPRLNVAPWNLTTRELSGTAPDQVLVNGDPLGFYHFTGFDSGAHIIMSKRNATGNKTVAELVDWYSAATANVDADPLSQVSWRFGSYSDGTKISPEARLIYRERIDLQKKFPDPYAPGLDNFKTWLEVQGKSEYPKLFDQTTAKMETFRLNQILTPGFQAGVSQSKLSLGLMTAHMLQALLNADHRRRVGKRAWEILSNEGMAGVIKRISK